MGTADHVLPFYGNKKYASVKKGNHFGIIDIIGCQILKENQEIDDWYDNRHQLKRQFTVMVTSDHVDALSFSIESLHSM